MSLPGTWLNADGTLAYRVLPKCACSTVLQVLYYTSAGGWFQGEIHDVSNGILKWGVAEHEPRIRWAVTGGRAFVFTCVRNPYSRILSAFFDKIVGIQRGGRRYRANLIPPLVRSYGVELDGDFDQIASFRRFLRFVHDTCRRGEPMSADLHWATASDLLRTLVSGGGRYDYIFPTEEFAAGMGRVLDRAGATHRPDLRATPRFNSGGRQGPERRFPLADYFGSREVEIMQDVYRLDFQLFHYDPAPGSAGPRQAIDARSVTAALA